MAFLAAHREAPAPLVHATLVSLYEQFPPTRFPTVVREKAASDWATIPLHIATCAYHDPYKGIGLLANFMDSLADMKELAFAFGARLYLLWVRWQRLKEKEAQEEVTNQKEQLDKRLKETVQIERGQSIRTRLCHALPSI